MPSSASGRNHCCYVSDHEYGSDDFIQYNNGRHAGKPAACHLGRDSSEKLPHGVLLEHVRRGSFYALDLRENIPLNVFSCSGRSSVGAFYLFNGSLNSFSQSFFTNNARIAFRTARIITPTSAKMASHMSANPSAPRARQISLIPIAKTMF